MVYMLLDAIKDLELVVGEDSRWYRYSIYKYIYKYLILLLTLYYIIRHPEHLKYPIDVQNMRYFIRLYKKK
ncbi:uncharacterized protein BX663DRAFT_503958 [Cokeromyces recurvatus]|uniref:uncharacterized protein n=1 Tax=Cokeromyces recurvatus TaxID=90255 RepID=UPI002220BC34|nr:uncharacterized protein BX663DRAFT_503958 [Cokeromyces recurvatus]KAI7904899.1 hypothetical protein BX663DRAFT_503958 [Cokeromyces recurvatus]